jgi:hypothetical protein
MLLRRTLAVLALAALTPLPPALAQPRPVRTERTASRIHTLHLFDLLFDRLAQIQEKLLGSTQDPASTLGPAGTQADSGSGLDPDGAR